MDNIPSEAQFGGSLTDNSTEEHKVKQDTGDDCETDYIHHPHPETRTDDLEKMLPDREQENNHQEITENTACENMDEETDTLRQCADHPFSESMCGKNPFEDDIRNSSHCSDCPPEFRIGNPFEDDSSEVSAVADDHAEERLKRSGTNPFEETEGEVSFSNGSASEGTPASGKNPFEEETDAETTAESAKFEEDETDAETSKQRTNLLKAAKENEIVAIDQLPTINEKQITDKDTSLSVQRPASCVDTDRLAKIQVKIEDVPEVRTIVLALLEMAFDKQEDIATTAVSTLRALGEKQPATVLRTLSNYLTGQGRPTCQLRLMILNVVDSTINPAIEMRQLDRSLASCLTKVALEEIVSITDPSPQIQSSASNILVSIGTVYCKDVIGMLSARLQPNSIPHQYILDSLASLATQNIYGVVPHLKSLLIALVDMLPQVRGSTMRSSFSSALAKFSEALIFYLTNIDRAPDPSIRRDWFADEITRAFDVLHTIWLPCKAPKLCQDILEALGYMSQLLPIECLDEMASKVLPSLLNAYKGPVEPLYVSRCLALFLEAYLNVSKEIVDAHLLDMLLNVLFLQVSASPDFSQPSTVKNHYEVLRCFEIVGRSHLERLVNFLLLKMEPASEKNRVASLIVVKHLVNSLKVQLQPHIALMQQHLKPLIGEQHNRVRKALAQTVVAMAVQGFLDVGADSSDFVSFLLKLCALPPSDNVSVFGSVASHTGIDAFLGKAGSQQYCAPGSVTNAELRQMSENVIHLLATTQPLMERILWPHLLVYTVNKDYNRAMTVISRALAHLVTKKHEENDTLLPETGRPSTAAIIARFLVLASCPVPVERGIAVLQFLLNFSAFVAKTLYKLWQDEIPPLISKLKTMALVDRFAGAEKESWLSSIHHLADATVIAMKSVSSEWNQQFSLSLLDQIGLYESDPLERGFLLHLIGMAVSHDIIPQGSDSTIGFIMMNVRHNFTEESNGCALAMGVCARSHLEQVLSRLQNLERNDYGRRSSGFLGFMKESRTEAESDQLKATAARCYGRVVLEAPSAEILKQIDKCIVKGVLNILQTSKDLVVRQEGLIAVACIGRAVSHSCLNERYILAGRPELLMETLIQIKVNPLPEFISATPANMTPMLDVAGFCVRALEAMSALVVIPPSIGPEDQSILLDRILEHVISMYDKLDQFANDEQCADVAAANESAQQLLAALEGFVLNLLREALHPGTVDVIFSKFIVWAKSKQEAIRRASLTLLRISLATFGRELTFEPGAPTRFSDGHNMLAKILPRCTDPNLQVRELAVDCLGLVFKIVSKYQGFSDGYDDENVLTLQHLKNSLSPEDDLLANMDTLSTILNGKTAASDLWPFLESLIPGLLDPLPSSSWGVSTILCYMLKIRGGEIHLRLRELLDLLLDRLKLVECPKTRSSILNAVTILAYHQQDVVATALLSHSLPHSDYISDCWSALAIDPNLGAGVLEYLINIVTYAAPYEERGHANESIASFRLLSAVSALSCMCHVAELEVVLQAHFSQLLCALLLTLSCFLAASPPIHFPTSGDKLTFVPNREAYRLNPYRITSEAVKSFLDCAQLSTLTKPLADYRQLENSGDMSTFCDMVASIANLTAVNVPAKLSRCIHYLNQALKSNYERHRLVAVAFYAELIQLRCGGREGEMLEAVISGLAVALADSSILARCVALKGLGGLGAWDRAHVALFAPMVLNALMDGLEEDSHGKGGNCGTAKEALEGLMRIIPLAPLSEVERLVSRLALRVRPFFESDSPLVRKAAVGLLAALFLAGSATSARIHLTEQVHATLTSLLLHLNESDANVVRACKSALRQAGPLLGCPTINFMFQTHLPDQGKLNYSAFLTDLVKLMSADLNEFMSTTYLQAAMSYFRSPWPELRANAAFFVGLVCGHTKSLNTSPISLNLTRLLQDPHKQVRLQAMRAIGLMYGSL